MPRKTSKDKAEYMREYRQRIREATSLEGKDLEAKLQEYKAQGLDKNDLFMDTIYALAMKGKNAKYADLWWRMTRPDPEAAKAWEPTADEYIAIGIKVKEGIRQELEQGGACPICGTVKKLREKGKW